MRGDTIFDAGLRSSRYPHPAISVDLQVDPRVRAENHDALIVLGYSDVSHAVSNTPGEGVNVRCLMHPLPFHQTSCPTDDTTDRQSPFVAFSVGHDMFLQGCQTIELVQVNSLDASSRG